MQATLPNATPTSSWVLPFSQLSKKDLAKVGGKGANLGEMSQAGFPVPGGFCITTDAYVAFLAGGEDSSALFVRLAGINAEDTEAVRVLGEDLRRHLQRAPIPEEIAAAIEEAWVREGAEHFYAVRSSATAEDLPGASFAGQQDTYLNIKGKEALLQKIKDCWISLFTDRAITYRARNGFDHSKVFLSVVVQRMARPRVSGILFTADPINGRRNIISIDAGFGLGEALVSGLISADLFKFDKKTRQITEKKISTKSMAILPLPQGGTEQVALSPAQQVAPSLTDAEVRSLAEIAMKIEAHYGQPQDIEWCLEEGRINIVQSRPITTLFPLPEGADPEGELGVYCSFNHAQVMTDAMPPLAQELWRRLFPIGRDSSGLSQIMMPAGGRLYLNISTLMRLPQAKKVLGGMEKNVDALMAGAIEELLDRPEYGPRQGSVLPIVREAAPLLVPLFAKVIPTVFWRDPQTTKAWAIRAFDEISANVQREGARERSPGARLKGLIELLDRTMLLVIPKFAPVLLSGTISAVLVRKLMRGRGVDQELAVFEQGLEGNATTEMDLLLGDLADLLRDKPHLIEHLKTSDPKTALTTIAQREGSAEFVQALQRFMTTFGMRGPSEIDISRNRWLEDPRPLVQMLIGNLSNPARGAHRAHYNNLIQQGQEAAARIIAAAPWSTRLLVRKLVTATRAFLFIREHPKLLLVRTLWTIKQTLLECAELLQRRGVLKERGDIFFLRLEEILSAVEGSDQPRQASIEERRQEFTRYQKMSPPRAITTQGEALTRSHKSKNMPANSLSGSPASPGVIEGIAKVVLDPSRAVLESGEILIAPFTDPGWTPLFMNAKGLVMEVGGLMTHGSVVAREYGIPAVVCVPDATTKIKTGQRVRVNGDEGWVQIIE